MRAANACVAGVLGLACATAAAQPVQASAQVRAQWLQADAASAGPVAQANALQPGLLGGPDSGATLHSELRASGHGLSAVVTLEQNRWHGGDGTGRAWVNELYAAHDGGAWQFSAGKKIVDWDVGYGFRPNDMVQQEERQALVSSTPEGRPLLMAEHFRADTAWSLVTVNPGAAPSQRGADEPALAVRVYQRSGAADWHGFARAGVRTGASLGAALAWVASDALELHGSLRYSARVDSQAMAAHTGGLLASNPWQARTSWDVPQALLGGSWTHASQLSVLLEAWWDGRALSDAQWDAWAQRTAQLDTLARQGAPAAAVAGNLAWQAQALGGSTSLRRGNVLLRLGWQHGAWQPTLDVLYTPADRGQVVTAALRWQGDRVQWQAGVRVTGGPAGAVLAQLPSARTVYLASTWSF